MTNDHALVLALMLVSLIGFATSRLAYPEYVYHMLTRRWLCASHP